MFDEIFTDVCKSLDQIIKDMSKIVSHESDGTLSANYSYPGLTTDQKMDIVKDKMKFWCDVIKLNPNAKVKIKFSFDKDEVYYMEWNKDYNAYLTQEPDGTYYKYDSEKQTLVKIDPIKKIADVKEPVSCCEKDKSVELTENDFEATVEPDTTNIKKDKNLAFNLKNAIEEAYKKDHCDDIFCPEEACEFFKEDVLDTNLYDAVFDEDGTAVSVSFEIEVICPDAFAERNYIYSNESANLDKFCELMKDKYGFSLGSWDATFEGVEKNVKEIVFTFTF